MPNFTPYIFLTSANKKQDLPNLANEFEKIREHLQTAEDKNLCQIEERCNFRSENLPKIFNNNRYKNKITFFHYSGHGSSENIDEMYAKGLAGLLSTQKNLAFVFLNACNTENHINFFNAHTSKVPCIIVTDKAVKDQIASEFAQHFYQSLGNDDNIAIAFGKAKNLIQTTYNNNIWRGLDIDEIEGREGWKIYYNDEQASELTLEKIADNPLALLPDLEFVKRDLPMKPFIGLKPYTAKYAPIFFGRDNEISDLYFKAINEDDHNIILISGQSGAGKSSLLTAGLLPRLKTKFYIDKKHYFRRSQEQDLTSILKTFLDTEETANFQDKWLKLEKKYGKPLLLVIDQAEEIFTSQAKDGEKETFFEQIKAIFGEKNQNEDIKGKLIISFRKEYLAEMTKQFEKSNIRHQTPYFIETLEEKNIIQAITGLTEPSYSNEKNQIIKEKYKLKIEDGFAQNIAIRLLDDDKSAIAPSLQILLAEMWKEAEIEKNTRTFNEKLYNRLKFNTLKQYLHEQIEKLKKIKNEKYKSYVESGLVLSLLIKYTTKEIMTGEYNITKNITKDFENDTIVTELIDELKGVYLLTDEKNLKKTRLAHDTLAKYVYDKYNERKYPAQQAETILNAHSETSDSILSLEELKIVKKGRLGMYKLKENEQRIIEKSEKYHNKKRREKNLKRFGGIAILILVMLFSGQFITVSIGWVILLVILMYYI